MATKTATKTVPKTTRKAATAKATKAPSTRTPRGRLSLDAKLNRLEDVQARIVELTAELAALRTERADLLVAARAAEVPYTKLASHMGDIPTGNIFAMVKAAEGR